MALTIEIDDIKNGWLVTDGYSQETTYFKTSDAARIAAKKMIDDMVGERTGQHG